MHHGPHCASQRGVFIPDDIRPETARAHRKSLRSKQCTSSKQPHRGDQGPETFVWPKRSLKRTSSSGGYRRRTVWRSKSWSVATRTRCARGQSLRASTIVDATIIAAPSSTKNKGREARSGHAPDQEVQPVGLRDEGAHWRGRRVRPAASRRVHGGQCGVRDQVHKLLHAEEDNGVRRHRGCTGADKREELQDVDAAASGLPKSLRRCGP